MVRNRLPRGGTPTGILARSLDDQFSDSDAFVRATFQQVLSRDPSEDERMASLEFIDTQSRLFQETAPAELEAVGEGSEVVPSADPLLRARENFVHALFSHSDFVTVR